MSMNLPGRRPTSAYKNSTGLLTRGGLGDGMLPVSTPIFAPAPMLCLRRSANPLIWAQSLA